MKKIILIITVCMGAQFFGITSLFGTRDIVTNKEYKCPYNDSLESAIICCMQNHPDDVKGCVKWTFDGIIEEGELDAEINRVKDMLNEIRKNPKILESVKQGIGGKKSN